MITFPVPKPNSRSKADRLRLNRIERGRNSLGPARDGAAIPPHDQQGGGLDTRVGADFSMRNTVSRSPCSMISKRSPITPTKWGMSITASGSVQRTSSRSPGVKDFKALRVLSAGRGHFSPDRSNLVMVMARHVRIVCRSLIGGSHRLVLDQPSVYFRSKVSRSSINSASSCS